MLNTVYEKPKMEFVNVQNENKIANTCWGYHGTDTLLYSRRGLLFFPNCIRRLHTECH